MDSVEQQVVGSGLISSASAGVGVAGQATPQLADSEYNAAREGTAVSRRLLANPLQCFKRFPLDGRRGGGGAGLCSV